MQRRVRADHGQRLPADVITEPVRDAEHRPIGHYAGAHLDMMCNEGLPVRTIVERVRGEGSMTIEETVRGYTSAVAT